MKELAEALKAKAGLRMRQGVVSAVDGSTVSVLIGGSTVAVDGVHHLNSVAPQVGEVVWIASDGADLWILGTHGDPPAIDPSRLPDYATYFASAAPEGTPATPTNVLGTALLNGLLVKWDRTAYDPWLTWEVQLSADSWVTYDTFQTAVQPVVVPFPPGGPFLLRVRAVNSVTSDVSGWGYDFSQAHANPTVEVDWDEMPLITETMIDDLAVSTPKLAANAVTAQKIDAASVQAAVVTAEAVNALEINASAIKAGTIDVARLDVASILASEITAANITGGDIEGVEITGSTLKTAQSPGARVEIDSVASNEIRLYSGSVDEAAPGKIESSVQEGFGPFLNFRSPVLAGSTYGSMYLNPEAWGVVAGRDKLVGSIGVGDRAGLVGSPLGGLKVILGNLWATGGGIYQNKQMEPGDLHPPSLSMIRTLDLSVADNTITYVTMRKDAEVEWDTHGFWDGEDNNAGPVIGMQGIYLIEVAVEWAAKASGWREVGIAINGSVLVNNRTISPGNILCPMTISAMAELEPSDLVQIEVRHGGTGAALQLNAKTHTPRLQLTWLRHRPGYGIATNPDMVDPWPGEYV